MMRRHAPRIAALLVTAIACATPSGPSATDAVGSWSSAEAGLDLRIDGGALTFQCASGTIDPGWRVDAQGRFTATGTYTPGGGVVPPAPRPSQPTRYSGRLRKGVFSLTVELLDRHQMLGPYQMRRDGDDVGPFCKGSAGDRQERVVSPRK